MSSSNLTGFVLAVISSSFIGSSFIIKKKGLQLARVNGPSASVGGYGYLLQPLWWVGMATMIVGEIANFVAYIYAPAVLVTPLGALTIIVSAVLAHFILKEKLQKMGMLGCLICILGSTIIVLHAPQEKSLSSVQQIWKFAIQPAFLMYTASAIAITLFLVLYCAPRYGQTNILVYIGICSIIGSLTVMSVKAIGIAIKLTLEGANQVLYFQTWIFTMVAITSIIVQLNYLNMMSEHVDSEDYASVEEAVEETKGLYVERVQTQAPTVQFQDGNLKYQELFAAYGPDNVDLNKPCVPHIIAIASRIASKQNPPILWSPLEAKCIRKKLNKKMEKTDGLVIKVTDNEVESILKYLKGKFSLYCSHIKQGMAGVKFDLSDGTFSNFKLGCPIHALDNFNTSVVSPIYYALFTAFTILASAIMFKDYSGQSIGSIVSELCGFITILSGTFLLHSTREPDPPVNTDLYSPLSPRVSWYIQGNNESWKQREEDVSPFNLIAVIRQDHFK